jgi:hypothetical protein
MMRWHCGIIWGEGVFFSLGVPHPQATLTRTSRCMGMCGPRRRVCMKTAIEKNVKGFKPTPSASRPRALALEKGVEKGREVMRKDAK